MHGQRNIKEEPRLKLFDKSLLRKILVTLREEIIGSWKKIA
jgi:hypothetical protein